MAAATPMIGFRKIPVMSAAKAQNTFTGPVTEVTARLHEIEQLDGVLDATNFCTQPDKISVPQVPGRQKAVRTAPIIRGSATSA